MPAKIIVIFSLIWPFTYHAGHAGYSLLKSIHVEQRIIETSFPSLALRKQLAAWGLRNTHVQRYDRGLKAASASAAQSNR